MNIEEVELFIKLLMDNKLDFLKVGDLEIHKSRFDQPKQESKPNNSTLSEEDDIDSILFHSTSAPALSIEELEAITTTPLKKKAK